MHFRATCFSGCGSSNDTSQLCCQLFCDSVTYFHTNNIQSLEVYMTPNSVLILENVDLLRQEIFFTKCINS